jgi:hypothetical protein
MGPDTPSWNATRRDLRVVDDHSQTAVPVSSYLPYSGITSPDGVVAELVDTGAGLAADFAGHNMTGLGAGDCPGGHVGERGRSPDLQQKTR